MMKFDVILSNPPYQKQIGPSKTEPLWNKFVESSFGSVKDGGYVCMIHPNGWRDVDGPFSSIKNLLTHYDIQYLETHNVKDSKKTFKGIQIMFDWYIATKSSTNSPTTIRFQDGSTSEYDLTSLPFIPSGSLEIFQQLIAKNGEEKVNILYNSAYHHQKPHMNKVQSDIFSYPCVYTIKTGDIPTFWYSSVDKGHFSVPKFIWGNGVCSSIGSLIDYDGKYGLTEFAYALVDDVEILPYIKTAFDSKLFKEVMKNAPNRNNNINRKVISLFKKDFWKFFL